MKEYDTFILQDLDEFPEGEHEMVIRELTPEDRRKKYRYLFVKALISKDPGRYPDRLWPRLGRGQWVGKPWSIKVLEIRDPIPERYR